MRGWPLRWVWAFIVGFTWVEWADAADPLTRKEIRIPDLPGYRTLKCDFHLHTVFSDGLVWPTWRVEEAWRDGLDAIALTDHIEYQPKTNDIPSNLQRPVDIAEGTARARGIILLRGAEITKHAVTGHFNAIFLTNIPAVADSDVLESLRRARSQGAFIFWNHPGWNVPTNEPILRPHIRTAMAEGLLDGIELANDTTVYTGVWDWVVSEGPRTWLGNSDAHAPVDPPLPQHAGHRTMTLVLARERSEAGIREALFAGRTVAWIRSELFGREEWLGPLVRACIVQHPVHQSDAKNVQFHLENVSDIPWTLRRLEGPGPAEILIPAGQTVSVRVPVATGQSATLVYEVRNAWVGPGKFVRIEWMISRAP